MLRTILVAVGMAAVLGAADVHAQAQSPESDQQRRISTARSAINDACLLGSQYELTMNGSAGISIKKRGVAGEVTVRSTEAKGNPGYVDEQLRLIADDKTRECMMKFLPRLLDALLPAAQKSDAPPQFPSTVLGFSYFTPRTPQADVTSYLKSGEWQFSQSGPVFVTVFDSYILKTYFDEDHKVNAAEVESTQARPAASEFVETSATDCTTAARIEHLVDFERRSVSSKLVIGNDPFITKVYDREVGAFYNKPKNAVQVQYTTLIVKKYPASQDVESETIPDLPKQRFLFSAKEAGLNEYTVLVHTYATQAFAGRSLPPINHEMLYTTKDSVWSISPENAKGTGPRTCGFYIVIEPRIHTRNFGLPY